MAQYQNTVDQRPYYQPRFVPSKMDASLKIDEGYSEDTRSQDDLDSPMRLDSMGDGNLSQAWSSAAGVPHQIMSLSEMERSGKPDAPVSYRILSLLTRNTPDFVYSILRTLRTSSIAAIVDRLRPLLHIDPVTILPPEITSEIFSYLPPSTLLEASCASRAWRERALDSRLWRQKFRSEGWGLDMVAIRRFEQEYRNQRKVRPKRAEAHGEQSRQKKRMRADEHHPSDTDLRRLHNGQRLAQDPQSWNKQHSEVEADDDNLLLRQDSANDEEMYDIGTPRIGVVPGAVEMQMASLLDVSNIGEIGVQPLLPQSAGRTGSGALFSRLDVEQSLVEYDSSNNPQINYNHVYKQKRKLEENWESGSYQSFQLPHRDHPEEAHRECVYTIQYSGNCLVSGSRDKTLRKWNLETQRLIGKPLVGHNASVLCLQFDDSEAEDLIASGSSDTDVILWRFSTGEMIQKIHHAHNESVLNLKFDSRFLVTCSKDKTIKIWNRRELRPGDADYPIKGVEGGGTCPAYILDLRELGSSVDIDRQLSAEEKAPLPPYTPIMILESHNAAVNAIYIYEDQLVSASGDRHVHLWNIHTGVRTSVCRGHTKGIACVQYDGKRIVSGSSDNTIRIFDPTTQAEVACLKGHTRLVRTIQSAFGDLPGKREELEAEAVEIDGKFHEARRAGKIPEDASVRTKERNPGSRDPKNIMAVGAKLPPGGGGSRWGRIVSGSYDETIIIWKKLADGRWAKAHVLRQEEALRAAGGPLPSASDLTSQAHQQALNAARAQLQQEEANLRAIQNARNVLNQNSTPQRAVGSQFSRQFSQQAGPAHVPQNLPDPAQESPQAYQSLQTQNLPPQQAQVAQNPNVHQIPATATEGGPDTAQQPPPAQLPPNQQQQFVNAIASAQNAAQN
ncbi:MAG: hypothetical protein Q9181_005571, partial [Wetmoreana brouardii]